MGVSQQVTEEASGQVSFRCRVCGEMVAAPASQQKTVERYYGIRLNVVRQTRTVCPVCQSVFLTGAEIEVLRALSPDQVSSNLALDVPFSLRFVALVGCLFFFTPVLGLVLSLVAYFKIQPSSRGWRRMAGLGTVLGAMFNIWFAYLALFVGFDKI